MLGIPTKDWIIEDNGLHKIKLDNGRCPMLNAKGLCKIVATLGPSYIGIVCKTYPRMQHQYGNVIEQFLYISCPDVIESLMSKDKIDFDYSEDESPYHLMPIHSYICLNLLCVPLLLIYYITLLISQ